MSLRSFHIFFIVTAIALMAFLGYWSGSRAMAGEGSPNGLLAAFSVIGLVSGLVYLGWFVRKTRELS